MAFVKCHHGNLVVTCVACGLEQKEAYQKKGTIEKIDVERLGLVEVKSVLFDKVEIAVDQYYAIEQVATKLNEIIDYLCEQQ